MIDSDVEKNVKMQTHQTQASEYRTVMEFAKVVVVNWSLDQMGY